MQSELIITDVVSSNLDQGEVYTIMWCDKICHWLSSSYITNKTDCHDISDILLKVALINNQTNKQNIMGKYWNLTSHGNDITPISTGLN